MCRACYNYQISSDSILDKTRFEEFIYLKLQLINKEADQWKMIPLIH